MTARLTRWLLAASALASAGCAVLPMRQEYRCDTASRQQILSTVPGATRVAPAGGEAHASTLRPAHHVPPPPAAAPGGAIPAEAAAPPGEPRLLPVAGTTSPASSSAVPASHQSPCLPDERQWRENFERQLSEQQQKLVDQQQRIGALEEEIRATRARLGTVTRQLESAQAEIAALHEDVGSWRRKVIQLEARAAAQHRADLESLNELSAALAKLLNEQSGVERN